MKKIGITGQSGFIGTHLYNFLNLQRDQYQIVPFEDFYFEDEFKLDEFVKSCDIIFHLAAMNRHGDPQVIYDTNLSLVNKLIMALEKTESSPHVLFSSSTQEERDNLYGRSKKDGRQLLHDWAKRNNTKFTGLILPNVFGPFGVPFYNSVISTFSHQLTNNLEPKIEIDAEINLIYINDLVKEFLKSIAFEKVEKIYHVPYNKKIKVSQILEKLLKFKELYFKQGTIPELSEKFDVDIFNTFRSYVDLKEFYPFQLEKKQDNRGYLVETIKERTGGQSFFSSTKPRITRGNHYHTRKIERFCVIKGRSEIKLRRIGSKETISFIVDGENPSFIDMPVWYTHNITNIGNDDLLTLFWCNEIFNPSDTDTYFEEV